MGFDRLNHDVTNIHRVVKAVVVGLREESAHFKKAAQEVGVMAAAAAAAVAAQEEEEEEAVMAVVQEVSHEDSVISAELPACTHI